MNFSVFIFLFKEHGQLWAGKVYYLFIGLTDLVGPLTDPTALCSIGVTRHRFDSKASAILSLKEPLHT